MVELMDGVPKEDQRFIYEGDRLSDDDKTLSEMEIEEGSVVYLLVRKTYAICTKFGKFFKEIDSLITISVVEDSMDSIEYDVHPGSFVKGLNQ